MQLIRIVQAPIGEAPDWVRRAWVGLSLPSPRRRPTSHLTVGVTVRSLGLVACLRMLLRLQGERVAGYAVPAAKAIEILEAADPRAASWWKENTPHLLRRGRYLVFDSDACEVADASSSAAGHA